MANARHRNSRLQAAVQRAGPVFAGTAVHFAALQTDGHNAMQAAERLLDYRQYLARARVLKAEKQQNDGEIDREVLSHARQAAADAQMLSLGALRMLRNLSAGGAVDRLRRGWIEALQTTGPVSCQDEWRHAIEAAGAREVVVQAGIPQNVLNAIDETMRGVDLEMSAEARRLVVTGTIDGEGVRASVNMADPPRRPRTVTELLTRGRFDQAVAGLERGEHVHIADFVIADAGMDLRDVVLAGALDIRREAVRHVRKLEDTGLATYQGGEPTTVGIVLGIALVAFVVGEILMAEYCEAPVNASDIDGSTGCVIGKLLFWLAVILTLGALTKAKGSSTGPANLVLGGPVVHGIVKEMELSRV